MLFGTEEKGTIGRIEYAEFRYMVLLSIYFEKKKIILK